MRSLNAYSTVRHTLFMVCLLMFCCLAGITPAQASYFAMTYGGVEEEYASSIQPTTDGGYIVTGWSDSFAAGIDIWTLKLDAAGHVLWQKVYETSCSEYASTIQPISNGGYIVAGGTDCVPPWGVLSAVVFQLDANGSIAWQMAYGGEADDYAESIEQTADNGYIVAGWTDSFGAGDRDGWIFKLSGDGEMSWQTSYGGSAEDSISSIQQTRDGGYIAAGYTTDPENSTRSFWIFALDSAGRVVWDKTYSDSYGYYDCEAASVEQTSDGGYIVAGSGSLVLKLDERGNILWKRQYSGYYISDIRQTADGGYIATGWTGLHFFALKLDAAGGVLWQKAYAGEYQGFGASIQQRCNGGYIAAGLLEHSLKSDVCVLKMDEQGNIPGSDIQQNDLTYVAIPDIDMLNNIHTQAETQATANNPHLYAIDTAAQPIPISSPADINVKQGDVDIPDNGLVNFGYIEIGQARRESFTIENKGFEVLKLTDSPSVRIEGNTSDFRISRQPSTNAILPDGSVNFEVEYTPTTESIQTATVTIENNDPDFLATPYTFTVCAIFYPQLQVKQGATIISNETGLFDIGIVQAGASKTVTFTLKNIGYAPLELTGQPFIQLPEGTTDFHVTRQPSAATIAPGGVVTFDLTFTRTGTETETVDVHIPNNEPDFAETPFTFTVRAVCTPEINIKQGDTAILDGTGFYDFGEIELGSSKTVTFTIENPENAPLILAGSPLIQVDEEASDFRITRQPSDGNVLPGETATFDITFTSSAAKTQTARIAIPNNDPDDDEAPYTFTVLGRSPRNASPFAAMYKGAIRQGNSQVIQQTKDGGYVAAGEDWALKLDREGAVLWKKSYTGGRINAIHQNSEGGYLVAGSRFSATTNSQNFWVLSLDADGAIIWQKTYGGAKDDIARFIDRTADGGYVVAGDTESFDNEPAVWLLNLDFDGNIRWQKMYGLPVTSILRTDLIRAIQRTSDGGYIVATEYPQRNTLIICFGPYCSESGGFNRIFKLNAQGDIVWSKSYGTSSEFISSMQQTRDGGYIAAGYTSPTRDPDDLWLFKLDPNGAFLWERNYGGIGEEQLPLVVESDTGGYVIAATTTSFGKGGSDIWLTKMSSAGYLLWQYTYGGENMEFLHTLQSTSDGGYILAGRSSSFGTGYNDFLALKVGEFGHIAKCGLQGIAYAHTTESDTASGHSNITMIARETDAVVEESDAQVVIEPPIYPDFICEAPSQATLTVTKIGNGVVTDSLAGIDCRLDCREAYFPGTDVTLTASPGAGTNFSGWSGGGCSGTGECVVTLDHDINVTAAFYSDACGGTDETLSDIIHAGHAVKCHATNSIRLLPGFHAEEGSTFRGYIGK